MPVFAVAPLPAPFVSLLFLGFHLRRSNVLHPLTNEPSAAAAVTVVSFAEADYAVDVDLDGARPH